MNAGQESSVVRFGPFELDRRTGELRKRGRKVRLQEMPFRTLEALVADPGQVVTRDELRRLLWPDDTFGDFDNGLNNAIARARSALGDSAANPRFIETVGRRGYRFICEVVAADAQVTSEPTPAALEPPPIAFEPALVAPAPRPVAPEHPPAPLATSRRPRRLRAAALMAAAGAVTVALLLARDTGAPTSAAPIRSIAVLPLDNLSGDVEREYFADGMTDAIITHLASIRALRVISRQSIMRYKENNTPMRQIAADLGVDAVVEGTISQSGNRVRITAQLIDARDDRHLWAQTFDREAGDVLALQSDVARAIAAQVHVVTTAAEQQRLQTSRGVSVSAHESFLKGKYHIAKGTEESVRRGIASIQEAIAEDPGYAPAHAWLAAGYHRLAMVYLGGSPAQWRPLAAAAAERALALDPNEPDALTELAFARFHEWKWAESERLYRRAIEVAPGSGAVRMRYAELLSTRGRIDESIQEASIAESLDPLNLQVITVHGMMLQFARRFEDAVPKYRSALDLDANYPLARWFLGMTLSEMGRQAEAVEEGRIAVRVAPGSPAIRGFYGSFAALAGDTAEAQRVLAGLHADVAAGRYVPPPAFASIYLALGKRDEFFAWMERGYHEHTNLMAFLPTSAWLDPVRGDARFKDLLRRVHGN